MNKNITNFPLIYSMDKDSFYKTIDDYIYERTYKKKYNKDIIKQDKISGVKSYHTKYFNKNYDNNNKSIELNANLSKIRDNITICDFDYSNQIKNILNNNNIIPQLPGYTTNTIFYNKYKPIKTYKNINEVDVKYNDKYNRDVPLPIDASFFNK